MCPWFSNWANDLPVVCDLKPQVRDFIINKLNRAKITISCTSFRVVLFHKYFIIDPNLVI